MSIKMHVSLPVPLIKTARFITSAIEPSQYPQHRLPEIAFAGKSNVGKSSLINALLGRKKLVKTSSRPGRTQTLNFFIINEELCFVDLPGYGYAQVSERLRMKWGPMVKQYIYQRNNLRGVVVLLDVRRKPSQDDLRLLTWLQECSKEAVIVAMKVDKISRNQRVSTIKQLVSDLGLDTAPIFFSALTGEGRENLWRALNLLIEL
jgi:GTP-binding protein